MTIFKRFKCPKCQWLSPGGYKVNKAKCWHCGTEMEMGFYKQYLNHCTLIEEQKGVER